MLCGLRKSYMGQHMWRYLELNGLNAGFFFYNRNFDFLYLFLCNAFLFCPIVVHITHMPASIVGKHALHKCTETVMAVVYTKTTAESAQLSDTIDTHKKKNMLYELLLIECFQVRWRLRIHSLSTKHRKWSIFTCFN